MSSIHSYELVEQSLNYMNEYPDYIDFVKNFNEKTGFLWSMDERIFKIFEGINNQEHSAISFALTLRVCQHIYKGYLTLEQYKLQKEEAQKRIFH